MIYETKQQLTDQVLSHKKNNYMKQNNLFETRLFTKEAKDDN